MQFVAPDADTNEPGNRAELKAWGAPIMRVPDWNDGDYRLQFPVAKSGTLATVTAGDWIIKEPIGDGFYPCTAEDFELAYGDAAPTGPDAVVLEKALAEIHDLQEQRTRLCEENEAALLKVSELQAAATFSPVQVVFEDTTASGVKVTGKVIVGADGTIAVEGIHAIVPTTFGQKATAKA